jgi:uncharacterized membrane protein YfcA
VFGLSLAFVLSALVVLATHALEAVTGFGCTVLALPFVSMLLGIDRAKFLLAILAWILALYIALTNLKQIAWREFGTILLWVGAGLPVGMFAFARLLRPVLLKALGAFIVVSASIQLYKRFSKAGSGKAMPAAAYRFLLVAGGIVHGAFAAGGPFVVLYAARALPDKGAFRATLCLLWACLNTVLIASFVLGGSFTGPALAELGLLLPVLALGIVLGEFGHARVDADLFSKVVFGVLLVTGCFMVLF